jgi:hypothetical protein
MLKQKFSTYGELKQFFDLINTRGLIFITYVCLLLQRRQPSLIISSHSTIFERQSQRETGCRATRSKTDRYVDL